MSTAFSESEIDEQIRVNVTQFLSAWKPPTEEQLDIWLRVLRPHWGRAELRAALSWFLVSSPSKFPPAIPEVIGRMEQLAPGAQQRVADTQARLGPKHAPLTDEERRRARNSAMLSALWLHYEFGWELQGESLKALFGDDVRQAAALAKAKFSREDVKRWMAERAIADPLPCDRDHIAAERL